MNLLRKLFPPALALLLCAACATVQQQGAFNRAQDAFDAGDYSTALQHLDRAKTYEDQLPATLAQIELLRGRCLEAMGNRAAAITIYTALLKNYPASPSATRAKSRLAELEKK